MRVLFVSSGNHKALAPFITEQADALRKAGNDVSLFAIQGHGICGYLQNLKPLKDTIARFHPDVVHAHYGLCGLLCTLQHKAPVVVTYHGSDINDRHILPFSRMAMHRAACNIFVSHKLMRAANAPEDKSTVLPCGVNLEDFPVMERSVARRQMNLEPDGKYILFAGAFDNPVKNAPLAQAAVDLVPHAQLIELKGYSRPEVALLMNAADALLMTSHSEGSPQVIKEAMAVGLPVVSVDVGDVATFIDNTDCGAITTATPSVMAELLMQLSHTPQRTTGRLYLTRLGLDNNHIAQRLMDIYQHLAQ